MKRERQRFTIGMPVRIARGDGRGRRGNVTAHLGGGGRLGPFVRVELDDGAGFGIFRERDLEILR